jgi:hypothetical protein
MPDGTYLDVETLAARLPELAPELAECGPHRLKKQFFISLRDEISRELDKHVNIDDAAVTFSEMVNKATNYERTIVGHNNM